MSLCFPSSVWQLMHVLEGSSQSAQSAMKVYFVMNALGLKGNLTMGGKGFMGVLSVGQQVQPY